MKNVILRAFSPEYQDFLFQLYASTRRQELETLGWPAAQQDAFLRMQFMAQQRWYEFAYADARHQLIFLDGQEPPVGRILVTHEESCHRLVDIALLPEHRGHGIGAQLIRQLIQEAKGAGLPLRLQVLKTNPAARLYERLGFVKTGEDQMYWQMEKRG